MKITANLQSCRGGNEVKNSFYALLEILSQVSEYLFTLILTYTHQSDINSLL